MKRAAAFLLAVFLLAAPVYAANVPNPTNEFYVNDYAGVLSRDTKDGIIDASVSLARETGAQIVVLTVESLDGMSMEDFGLEVGRSWGIGSKKDNNGVLLLLSTGDREIRLEVGYGLEGAINDAKAGRLIDNYAIPYYAENNFDIGTYELYKAVLSVVREEYGLDPLEGYSAAGQGNHSETKENDWPYIAIIIVFLLVFAIIVLSILYSIVMAVLRLILMPFGIKIPYKKNRVLAFLYLFMITFSNGRRGGGGGSRGGGGSFGGGGAGRRF